MSTIHDEIRKVVSGIYDGTTGEMSDEAIRAAASSAIIINEKDAHDLGMIAIDAECKRQKRIRSIEKMDTRQGDLFSDGYLDTHMAYSDKDRTTGDLIESGVVKMRHAKVRRFYEKREEQIKNMRHSNAAFERTEMRREKLDPIWAKHPEYTIEEAINDKSYDNQ